jgi:ABC-type multidrug transport system permease subunit
MFHLTPFRYLLGAFLSDVLHDVPVNCENREFAIFSPPSGTCQEYLQSYFDGGAPGYLNNPTATSNCEVCPVKVGDEYLATLEIYWDQRWAYVGYFIACVLSLPSFLGEY